MKMYTWISKVYERLYVQINMHKWIDEMFAWIRNIYAWIAKHVRINKMYTSIKMYLQIDKMYTWTDKTYAQIKNVDMINKMYTQINKMRLQFKKTNTRIHEKCVKMNQIYL